MAPGNPTALETQSSQDTPNQKSTMHGLDPSYIPEPQFVEKKKLTYFSQLEFFSLFVCLKVNKTGFFLLLYVDLTSFSSRPFYLFVVNQKGNYVCEPCYNLSIIENDHLHLCIDFNNMHDKYYELWRIFRRRTSWGIDQLYPDLDHCFKERDGEPSSA